MTSWLHRQKKSTLLELSSTAGLKQDEDSRKDDLVDNLDKHLQANSTRLAGNSSFATYFETRRTPFKRQSSAGPSGVTSDDGEVKSVVKARGRRTTKVKQETEDEDAGSASPSQALVPSKSGTVAKTPGRPRRRSELLPASPADIADDIDYATQRAISTVGSWYNRSGITDSIENLREKCSSVAAVHLTLIALEGIALQFRVVPWEKVTDVGSYNLFGFNTPDFPLPLPNFFKVLSGPFWQSSFLWASTSIFIPLLFAYFYNLSTRDVKRHGARVTVSRYLADPFTFNIVKALATWIVYGQGYTFGVFDEAAIVTVQSAVFGGYTGLMVGSFVGMLVSLYEAAQR